MANAMFLHNCLFSSKHLLVNNNFRRLGCVWPRSRSRSLCHAKHAPIPPLKEEEVGDTKLRVLKQKMEAIGINCDDSCTPGLFHRLFCPKCKGGQSLERSLSLHIIQDGDFALWRCFRNECGWAGQAFAENGSKTLKVKSSEQMTFESLGLELLGGKLIAYFRERKISEETLSRNAVMQLHGDQSVIAFTYRQNGLIVGCKYRTMERKFWQAVSIQHPNLIYPELNVPTEKGTEKTLYGLDDIHEADEIIIVEGETDKLSFEEAGFRNCVSVPGGAPQKVSAKDLPSSEKDIAYQYLWNGRVYLDKASRIILATDGDTSGQALAEELARRLGKERCWRVCWPKKDEFSYFKDANEVLQNLGPYALKQAIENAELYQET